jgi:CMP-N-acetylneuraminic acid synthetase
MRRPTFTALVPMKGHSARVPGKNLRLLGGKPLCHWILEALSQCESIEEIVVNTDCEAIAESVSENFDVRIHWRPESIQGDFVSMNTVIADDMARLPRQNYFLQTHSTNPFLKKESIEEAVDRFLRQDKSDSLFTVTRFQGRFYDQNGQPCNHDPSELRRTQDLSPLFLENSNLYVFTRRSFGTDNQRIGQCPMLHELPSLEALDIDEEEDFKLAELVNTKDRRCQPQSLPAQPAV